MIAYLSGNVIAKHERTVVVNVNGVGYLVSVPRGTHEKIILGEPVELHIHTNVREDDLSLYGFSTLAELQFFKLVLTVSGVGPKSALEILSAPLDRVRHAIAKKDPLFLTKIQGIGKKTAERIIVDLQGKIQEQVMSEEFTPGIDHNDIIAALTSLGYSRAHVVQGLKKVPDELTDEESIIKYFLHHST